MIIDFDIIGVIICFAIWCVAISFLFFIKKMNRFYILIFTLTYAYLCMVVEKTQFPIYCLPGMEQTVFQDMQLVPLISLTSEDIETSVLNVFMTIPFGFMLQFIKKCTWKKTLQISACFGISIELCQLVVALIVGTTHRVVDINDVIFNTFGGMIGFGVFFVFKKIVFRYLNKEDAIYRYLMLSENTEK